MRFITHLKVCAFSHYKVKKNDEIWGCLMVFLEWFSEWLVPKFEDKNIIHANQEVPVLKSAIEKLKKL